MSKQDEVTGPLASGEHEPAGWKGGETAPVLTERGLQRTATLTQIVAACVATCLAIITPVGAMWATMQHDVRNQQEVNNAQNARLSYLERKDARWDDLSAKREEQLAALNERLARMETQGGAILDAVREMRSERGGDGR